MFQCMRNPSFARVMFQKECLAWHLDLAGRLRTALVPSFERISRDVLGNRYVYGWGARVCPGIGTDDLIVVSQSER